MCHCIGVEIGSYGNQVALPRPTHMEGRAEGSRSDVICVDACLKEEIIVLWSAGIRTTGCCCGHNELMGYIGVIGEDIPRMKAMGYEVRPNTCRPGDEDSFKPKTLKE